MTTTIADVLFFLIEKGPGRTEAQLAEAIFGSRGYPQRVNQDCQLLAGKGAVERRGAGGSADPFKYFIKGTQCPTDRNANSAPPPQSATPS